jgi:hypothetical protein
MSEHTFDVTEFGATGDGDRLDTEPVQAAIDACSESGGGTVSFPPGTYLAGTLSLRSDVTLELGQGAVLRGSEAMDDYDAPPADSFVHQTASRFAFLHGVGVDNVTIRGEGTIDGNMALDEGDHDRGPLTLIFEESSNLTVQGVTVRSAPSWSVTFWGCQHVDVLGVQVLDSYADGINPCCCQDVLIDGAYVEGSGDDPICLKSESPGYDPDTAPECGFLVRDVVVTNTTIRDTTHPAIKFGTGSQGVMRNVVVSDCTVENTGALFTVQLMRPSLEATPERCIENVRFSNIVGRNVERLLDWTTIDVSEPVIRNITVEDVTLDGSRYVSLVSGLPEAPIEDVTLSGVTQTIPELGDQRGTPAEASVWLDAEHVDGLTLRDIQLSLPETVETVLRVESGSRVEVDNLSVEGEIEGPVVDLTDVADVFVHDTRAPETGTFLAARGETSDLAVAATDLGRAATPLLGTDDVPAGAVRPVAGDVEYADLSVADVAPDEPIEVAVTMRNPGPAGAVHVPVRVEDEVVASRWTWLDRGESRTVTVGTPPRYASGSYEVSVGDATATVTVAAAPATFEYEPPTPVSLPAGRGTATAAPTVRNVGGERGTETVALDLDGETVSTESVALDPGEARSVALAASLEGSGPRTLRVDEQPPWPYATFANTDATLSQDGHRVLIEAAGTRRRMVDEPDGADDGADYATAYRTVEGDFTATAKLHDQEPAGVYAVGGLLVANDLAADRSAGRVVLLRYVKYGGMGLFGADLDGDGVPESYGYPPNHLPMWFRLRRRGRRFVGAVSPDGEQWTDAGEYEVPSADPVQDVGVVAKGYTDTGERTRAVFEEFHVEEP